ncbi:MAG: hypothetical protein WC054_08910, partial [Candidatus Nanopelagicales bacterium]
MNHAPLHKRAHLLLSVIAAWLMAMAGLVPFEQQAQGVQAQGGQGACPTSDGVTVIVDATPLGGSLSVRCASGRQSSGLAALRAAGFSWTPVSSQPAMVCRIDGRPGPGDESCVSTPPAKAYWGYYRANRGADWRYSSVGAAAAPIQGGVEGWVFLNGAQRPPSAQPPGAFEQAKPVAPAPTTSARPTKSPTPAPSKAGAVARPGPATSPSETPSSTELARGSSSAVEAPPSIATAPAAAVAAAVATTDAVVPTSGGGSALTTLFGVVILVGLVIGAVVLSTRRRG